MSNMQGSHSANGLGWNGLKSLDCILDIFGSVAIRAYWIGLVWDYGANGLGWFG